MLTTLGKKDRHDKMDCLKRKATFGAWFADDPGDFIFFPGERSAILLAVDMAKTIIAEYDQRKRKCYSVDGVSNKRSRLEDGNEIQLTNSTSSSPGSSNVSQVTIQQSPQPVLRKDIS